MNALAVRQGSQPIPNGVWDWWQARRLRYNVALAAAGAAAYALTVALHYAFGDAIWASAREAFGQTLFLGTLYLGVIGIANICYLIGPLGEAWLKPADPRALSRRSLRHGAVGLCGPALPVRADQSVVPRRQRLRRGAHARGTARLAAPRPWTEVCQAGPASRGRVDATRRGRGRRCAPPDRLPRGHGEPDDRRRPAFPARS